MMMDISSTFGMRRHLGMYLEVIKKSFMQAYVYRVTTWLNLISAVITVMIQINLWSALLANRAYDEGITFQDMMSFVFINTLLLSFMQTTSGSALAGKIHDGSIAIDFLRPINLKYYLFAEDFGKNLYRTLFSVAPVCGICVVFYRVHVPNNLLMIVIFVISIINGILIIFYIYYLFGLLAFWLHTAWYIPWYVRAVFQLFGGTFVPLWFYPPGLAQWSRFLPFRHITFEPIAIYLGKHSLAQSLSILCIQLGWILVLHGAEQFLWRRAQHKIIVQGG